MGVDVDVGVGLDVLMLRGIRRPQTQTSNVIGIGKWAHTATGNTNIPGSGTPQSAPTLRGEDIMA